MNPLPAHDIDAEATILANVMLNAEKLDQVDFLSPEHFYAEAHRQTFAACRALREKGQPCDSVQVGTWLKNHGRIAQVGGMAYLVEMIAASPAAPNLVPHGRTVFEKWRIRRLCEFCERTGAAARGDLGDDVQAFLDGAETSLREITQAAASQSNGERLDDVVKRVLGEIAKAGQSGTKRAGVLTGFDGLDRVTHGLQPSTVTIVAARPGMGKSALALNMAQSIATAGLWVPFFSLEMTNDEQGLRTISAESEVYMSKLQSAELNPLDWNRLTAMTTRVSKSPLYLFDESDLSPHTLGAKVRRLQLEAERHGSKVGAVFVDYLQLMKPVQKSQVREQEVSGISRALKLLAKSLKIPLVVMAQLNRDGEKGAKPVRPQLSSLRESGAIEQDADVVIFIHREAYYSKDNRPTADDVAELIIAKGRNIEKKTVKVKFDGRFTKFSREELGD